MEINEILSEKTHFFDKSGERSKEMGDFKLKMIKKIILSTFKRGVPK